MAPRLQYELAMNHIALTAVVVSCLSFGALGCSTTASMAPHSPVGASDVAANGTPDDTMLVVATHVVPKAGVSAVVEGDHIALRFATTGNRRVALALDPGTLQILGDETSPVEGPSSGSFGAASVDLPHHGHLVAWTDGSVQTGFRVRAVTLSADGSSETPISIGDEGSAVGRPAVAVTPGGNAVVAFIESNDDGFQLVVKHVTCAAL
jgi:hypothetical protein